MPRNRDLWTAYPKGTVQVHRFRDRVALAVPGAAQTVYLTAAAAHAIGLHLLRGAQNVTESEFAHSAFGTHTVDVDAE